MNKSGTNGWKGKASGGVGGVGRGGELVWRGGIGVGLSGGGWSRGGVEGITWK